MLKDPCAVNLTALLTMNAGDCGRRGGMAGWFAVVLERMLLVKRRRWGLVDESKHGIEQLSSRKIDISRGVIVFYQYKWPNTIQYRFCLTPNTKTTSTYDRRPKRIVHPFHPDIHKLCVI